MKRHRGARRVLLLKVFVQLALLLATLMFASKVQAQSCDHVPNPGNESISATVKINGTTTQVTDGMVLPPYTQLRIDSVASAFGSCTGMAWNCSGGCTCEPSGYVYERTINHTNVWVDVSTNTGLNGSYSVGWVWGVSSDQHVLDTTSSSSSGPNYYTPPYAGTYEIHVQGIINGTPCSMTPYQTEIFTITVHVSEGPSNLGATECNNEVASSSVGKPVNVTNGNMYIQQTDYRLPGFGEGFEITRTYNSQRQLDGLFGYGWHSILDEAVHTYGTKLLRVTLADGNTVYLARASSSSPYLSTSLSDFHGQVVKNPDNSYTLTFKDGRVHQFNPSGKLISITDRNGNTSTFTLNGNGNPTTITDASGRTITIVYDAYDRIGSLSDSLGTIATYTHGFWGRLTRVSYPDGSQYNYSDSFIGNGIYVTSVTDALGNVLESHTYDSQGRALTSEIAGNGTERYTLNYVSASETHVTDALNRVTKYFFDATKGRNVLTRVEGNCSCGGGSQVQTWTYDSQLNLTARTDALNHTTTYTYDTNGNRLTETNSLGTTSFTYNSFGQVLTRTDPMNGVWTNTYDVKGNLLTAKDALNNTTTLTYSTPGQLLTITDPRNNTTSFTYDTHGNLTRRTDALNNQTTIAYDTRGRVTSVTNALNQVTGYEYDSAGRLQKVIYPDTNFVLFTYDLAGRRTKIKDPRGNETAFAYDAAYRLTSATNADNKVTSYAYDLMSNLTGVTDALNRTTNYSYDEFDRVTKIKYPEATQGAGRLEENFSYDLEGNLITKTDQAGRETTFCYDSAHRLTSTIDPAQKSTAYEYNARSQMTAVVDAINQRYEFSYDPLGRRTQEKKGSATMSFVYDGAGNRSQRTDYNNAVTNYTHDALNRLTTISYPDSTGATYGYDVLSRLTTATNPTGTVTIAYDNRGRVSSVTDVFGQVVSYGHDANSNRTQLSLNTATSATYQYDVVNRLTQLADGGSLSTTFTYDATNKLTSRTLPNGVTSSFQYDGLDRLTHLTHTRTSTVIADYQFQFNSANNFTQLTDSDGAHSYSYDLLDRLTSAIHPSPPSESYTYDGVGNRIASHQGPNYSYQPFNRLIAANGSTFSYDANGNLSSKTDGSGTSTYSWDYDNNLLQVSPWGGANINYAYDAIGRRILRSTSTGSITKFVYDGLDVVRDLNSDLTTATDHLNSIGVDNKLRETDSQTGISHYLLTDHLGSTRVLTDSSGEIVEQVNYDSFGNSIGSAFTRYSYTGREQDDVTGQLYYRARFYDPEVGRFLSEDPIGFAGQDINLYTYVHNSPLLLIDPFGEQSRADARWQPGEIENARRLADAVRRMPPPGPGFYSDMHQRRVQGHNRFPGEPNSAMRHCVVSCESARQWGRWGPRVMGIGNEAQGIVLDIQRWWRGRPMGAFQLSDLLNNERGFQCHLRVNGGCCQTCEECCSGACSTGTKPPPRQGLTIWDKR